MYVGLSALGPHNNCMSFSKLRGKRKSVLYVVQIVHAIV